MAEPVRRNVAHLTTAERQAYASALRNLDLQSYADGVSYWDKQDQIHEGTHNHQGNSFIPWHRELVNRFEKLLQLVEPDMALHYWDWTQDPRAADNGQGGVVDLTTNDTFGTANGLVAGVLGPLHNGGSAMGARPSFGGPWTLPPVSITRGCAPGAPGVASDNTIITSSNGSAQAQQWTTFRQSLENSHDTAHTFFGAGNIFNQHTAFEDPFVFLLHSNLDRLFAMWQTVTGGDWRRDPDLVYGDQAQTNDAKGILHNLQPWDGTVEFGSPIPPWTGGSSDMVIKNCRHPSVIRPPCYDTLPLTTQQLSPTPGDPLRFLDVGAGEQTARALRLRLRACQAITAQATLAGDPAFALLSTTVTSPEPDGFESHDLLVWVLYTAGAANSSASGTLTVAVPATSDTYSLPIQANAITKPTVASSLVLDRSASMDEPSGLGTLKRIEVLRNAAPLFVQLLDDADGVGVVRFDTDAAEAEPVQVAGAEIGGVGRSDAITAISQHTTNPNGWTAIGDGLEVGAAQLNVAAGFTKKATVVFTDGFETAPKYVSDVMDLVTSTVYAIGLGTAEQINPTGLNNLVAGTEGYVLLTGNPGPDDLLLLQKYFAQVIAGVTNTQIVVDPDGFVPLGGQIDVPYQLTEGDTRCDAIMLSPAASVLTVSLVAPDGTQIDGGNGAATVSTPHHQLVRLPLPTPAVAGPTAGQWAVRLGTDKRGVRKYLKELRGQDRRGPELVTRVETHGIPFTVTVQARSSVRLVVFTSQPSRRPGTIAGLTAVLTQAGIPLARTAAVLAQVRHPDGGATTLPLAETSDGVFTADLPMPIAGVYQVTFIADGTTLGGQQFTRAELRTPAVWSRGDEPPPESDPATPSRLDLCQLLRCLLKEESVQKTGDRLGIDLDAVRRCLDQVCRPS